MENLVVPIPEKQPSVAKRKRGHSFEKGNPGGPGRPKGGKNKFSREIKQAVLDAIEYVGEEKAGEYLAAMKEANPKVDLEKLKADLPPWRQRVSRADRARVSRNGRRHTCAFTSHSARVDAA